MTLTPEDSQRNNQGTQNHQNNKCCNSFRFNNVKIARGLNLLGVSRGALVISNLFLSISLLELASEAAQCGTSNETVSTVCKIYGFRPSSLITNMAVISGLIMAFTMPIIGAIVDYSAHRRLVGISSAIILILIQAIQIGTVRSTWFPMALLQAIALFLFQVQKLAAYAYFPSLSNIVGESQMANFTSIWMISQYASALGFLLLLTMIGLFVGMNDVERAQMSQGVNVLWSGLAFFAGWKLLPDVPKLQAKPEGQSYSVAGFSKLWDTTKGINSHYGGSIRWFFLAVAFGEAGMEAFVTASVTYLNEILEMNGGELGIVFALVHIATIPGARIGYYLSIKKDPIFSLKVCHLIFCVSILTCAFVLSGPEKKNLSYIWFVLFGISLGWAYPTEDLIFSMCLPKGQEAELSGFFLYCTQIIAWLPPLIFTSINESGVHMKFAVMSMSIFFFIAWIFLMLMDPWTSVLTSAKTNRMIPDRAEREKQEQEEAIR